MMWIKKFAVFWICLTSFFGLFAAEIVSTNLPIFKCIEYQNGKGTCDFNDLDLNETHPYFKPVLESWNKFTNGEIYHMRIFGKSIAVLTNDICKHFPTINNYSASNLGIKAVHRDAFEACPNLKALDLSRNQLTSLASNIFYNDSKLEDFNLSGNQLKIIAGSLIKHTPKLKLLNLRSNRIMEFSIEDMPFLSNLETLDLRDNRLTDLNENLFYGKFPALQSGMAYYDRKFI